MPLLLQETTHRCSTFPSSTETMRGCSPLSELTHHPGVLPFSEPYGKSLHHQSQETITSSLTTPAASVTTRLNYINPETAQDNPETPLPRELGEEGKKLYIDSAPQTVRNGHCLEFRFEKGGFKLLSNVSVPLITNNPRERYYAARSICGPLSMKLVQERYPYLDS